MVMPSCLVAPVLNVFNGRIAASLRDVNVKLERVQSRCDDPFRLLWQRRRLGRPVAFRQTGGGAAARGFGRAWAGKAQPSRTAGGRAAGRVQRILFNPL